MRVAVSIGVGLIAASLCAAGELGLERRLEAHRALESVRWQHRIWPEQNEGVRPPVEALVSDDQLRARIDDYMKKSRALAELGRPITRDALQQELDRIVRDSKAPALLRQLFAALDDDPALIAECIARPLLADRLTRHLESPSSPSTDDVVAEATIPDGGYTLSSTTAPPCPADRWTPIGGVPRPLSGHRAVWTGSEMIVWGGSDDRFGSGSSGARYRPEIDAWQSISGGAGAPGPRSGHSAVWTGSEMIVWGGGNNTGGRYDPVSDTWRATSTVGAPEFRSNHEAVWTGTEMIVWGGEVAGGVGNTGGRYDPVSDSWTPITTVGAPAGRTNFTAVWTGGEMVVWGGWDDVSTFMNDGGRYDPATDTWTPTASTGAPSPRAFHGSVFGGGLVLVWGGLDPGNDLLGDGARYDPATDTWTPMTPVGAPQARRSYRSVWTGSEMILFGGRAASYLGSGGRYDPLADAWAPIAGWSARAGHSAVWTGDEMIVWGGLSTSGRTNTGARYDPALDGWLPISDEGPVDGRFDFTAVWTGAEMVVWGGLGDPPGTGDVWDTGGQYDPATDAWSVVPSGGIGGRYRHTAVWTGTQMVVWGGQDDTDILDTGGRYNPSAFAWSPLSTVGAPAAKVDHSAVWSGSEMIVWGGGSSTSTVTRSGGMWDPVTDTWTPVSPLLAPEGRRWHAAAWDGTRMLIWGGEGADFINIDSGGRFEPSTQTWTPMTQVGAPSARALPAQAWTGSEWVIWGGGDNNPDQPLASGGRYDPAGDTWQPTTLVGAPPAAYEPRAVWTGDDVIVWGGSADAQKLSTGGRYQPLTDNWRVLPNDAGVPERRSRHQIVWSGSEMIVWGGEAQSGPFLNSGSRFCACPEDATLTIYYRDRDLDGHGDPDDSVESCATAVPGDWSTLGDDCDDMDASAWAPPGEARDLDWSDATTLNWSAPLEPGGQPTAVRYDVLRADAASDFDAATCVESNDLSDTSATDPVLPAADATFFYLVRAENGCDTPGPLGADSAGQPRSGRACP